MISRSHIRRALGHFLLALMLVVHAPIAGVMAAQAGHGAGQGLVICVDGHFAEIDFPAEPQSEKTGAHECLCPCGTLSAGKVIAGGSALGADLRAKDLRRAQLPHQTRALRAQMPQTGQGSPRSPPQASL
ncbi:MAG: hypothetical protein AAGF81_08235 [Pseudomonadota bacterium]